MDCCVVLDSDMMCICNMHDMISGMKLKINTSLTMYNLENELIIYLVSYIWKLHQEITNLKHLRVYSYLFLSSNQKKKKNDIDTITLQKLKFFPRITFGNKDRC